MNQTENTDFSGKLKWRASSFALWVGASTDDVTLTSEHYRGVRLTREQVKELIVALEDILETRSPLPKETQ